MGGRNFFSSLITFWSGLKLNNLNWAKHFKFEGLVLLTYRIFFNVPRSFCVLFFIFTLLFSTDDYIVVCKNNLNQYLRFASVTLFPENFFFL